MIEVIVNQKLPNEVLDLVHELRSQGLVQGSDFDFAYHQAKYDPITGHHVEDKYAVFKFHTEKYASLFALRYGS